MSLVYVMDWIHLAVYCLSRTLSGGYLQTWFLLKYANCAFGRDSLKEYSRILVTAAELCLHLVIVLNQICASAHPLDAARCIVTQLEPESEF